MAGCVSAPSQADDPKPAQLLIARGMNGVNMQWDTEIGKQYTLVYLDPGGTQWQPVPGYQTVEGTGELVEVKDTSPGAMQRRYRVRTLPPQ